MDHIALMTDKRVLHPVRDKNDTAKLTLTAFYSNGSQSAFSVSEAVVTARTKHASGDVQVVMIEGDRVIPKEGGIATIEATVTQGHHEYKAATDVVRKVKRDKVVEGIMDRFRELPH